ncbi:hypothetical protein FQN60_005430 [Etheostoma spectabile]|uniref:Uncharacterized protein n=1 Tax=Etheostoma spectabile TaxID=54343 RepID=A0A5J5CFT9_9PERO|nr:hypothetical protein FQN60_005430 [Etheostoma spectabile]
MFRHSDPPVHKHSLSVNGTVVVCATWTFRDPASRPRARQQLSLPPCTACCSSSLVLGYSPAVKFYWWLVNLSPAAMSGFNLLHLITKSQPVTLRPCSLPSGPLTGCCVPAVLCLSKALTPGMSLLS